MTCEYIIIATDGRISYRISINNETVKETSFKTAQSLLNDGCRLVELDSYTEVMQFSRDGFRLGFPSDKSNWDFFSEQ